MGIKFAPLAARRHNKAGAVERKHRVIKDILERLENAEEKSGLPLEDRLAEACFISNITYGNRTASALNWYAATRHRYQAQDCGFCQKRLVGLT